MLTWAKALAVLFYTAKIEKIKLKHIFLKIKIVYGLNDSLKGEETYLESCSAMQKSYKVLYL